MVFMHARLVFVKLHVMTWQLAKQTFETRKVVNNLKTTWVECWPATLIAILRLWVSAFLVFDPLPIPQRVPPIKRSFHASLSSLCRVGVV